MTYFKAKIILIRGALSCGLVYCYKWFVLPYVSCLDFCLFYCCMFWKGHSLWSPFFSLLIISYQKNITRLSIKKLSKNKVKIHPCFGEMFDLLKKIWINKSGWVGAVLLSTNMCMNKCALASKYIFLFLTTLISILF